MKRCRMRVVVALSLVVCALQVRADLALSTRGGSSLPLVLAKNPAPSLAFAAKEWNRYLERLTGGKAALLNKVPAKGGCVELVMEPLVPGDDDSFTLVSDDRKLTIRGGTRGILYGVYEVLETYGGVGWYSRFYTHVPRLERLAVPSDLNRREVPAFDVRWPGWGVPRKRDGHLAVHQRYNGTGVAGDRPQFGGVRYRFGKGWSGHTFNRLCSAEKYGKDHPEYFSEIRGRRRLTQTQLCTTNPDVREIACSNLFAAIRSDPTADVWGIGQNDYYFFCECPKCAAIDAREESNCGAVLEFVNFLADRVAKEFPGKLLKFSAYQFTRKPPKYLRPASNVVINLCAIECDFSRPFGQPDGVKANLEFERDFDRWSKISSHFSIYDYTTNYRYYMHPFPNLETIAGNIRYYRDHGVKILYCEGGNEQADLSELKTWLIAKLAWNPDRDFNGLLEEFCRGYYGKAAPNVLDYIRSARACITANPGHMSIFEALRPKVYTDAFLDRQMENFRNAEAAVADDPDRLYNVRMTGAIVYATKLDYLADRTKFWWATEHPEAFDEPTGAPAMLDWLKKREAEFTAKAKSSVGFTLCANRGRNALAKLQYERLAAWKRPAAGSRSGFIPALEMTPATPNNGFHGGWFVREVEDAAAHGGKAAEVNCDFPKCVLSFRTRNVALDKGERYAVRIRVRGAGTPGAKGEAFAVLDIDEKTLLSISATSLSDEWKWYDIGELVASDGGGYNIVVGRVSKGGDGAVKTLVVDGVEISKIGR